MTNANNKCVEIENKEINVISLSELNNKNDVGVILGLNVIHHDNIKEELSENMSVFMSKETTYSYEDIIEFAFIVNQNK